MMTKNGEEMGRMSDLDQWQQVPILNFGFAISGEKAARQATEIRTTLGKIAGLGMDFDDRKISPFTDVEGNTYGVQPSEWADVLERRAEAVTGISYAGEPPALIRPAPANFTGFDTLP
jgi:hypothetical protein